MHHPDCLCLTDRDRRELCKRIVDRRDSLFHCARRHHGLQLFKADGAIDAETARARSFETGKMRSHAQSIPYFGAQRADV